MGANGAGKSTLVKIITGVFPADAGTIALGGEAAAFRSPAEARAAGIVSVYQDPALVPDLTVAQNMRLARVPLDGGASMARRARRRATSIFSAFVRDLPYPILRLIDLARALASDPKLLLLDEITAALPADLAEHVFAMVRRWRDRGHSVIFISHRMAEVSALCDRATVLRDGVTVGVTDTAQGSEDRIVVADARGRRSPRRAPPPRTGAPAAAAPHGRARPSKCAGLRLRPCCCTTCRSRVAPGEVLGVAALEGQGQEELFDCIAGVRRLDGGDRSWRRARELRLRHPGRRDPGRARAGAGQPAAGAAAAALDPRERRAAGVPPAAALGADRACGRSARASSDAVRRLQIDTRAESELRRLSGGNQQKVVIARWLASGFKTLLCFDPTRGIDIGTKRQIYALVREIAGGGRVRAAVHLRTARDPARLRPRHRAVRRPHRRTRCRRAEADEATPAARRARARRRAPRPPRERAPTPTTGRRRAAAGLRSCLRGPAPSALFGMPALLVAALAFTVLIHPDFGAFDVQSLALGALPLALAAAAQTIVVISRRHRSFHRLADGGRQRARRRARCSTRASAQSLVLAGADPARPARSRGALNGVIVVRLAHPRRGGDADDRLHLGRRRAADPRKARRRRAAGLPRPRRRHDLRRWLPNALILLVVVGRGRSGCRCAAAGSACCSTRSAATGSPPSAAASTSRRTRILAYVVRRPVQRRRRPRRSP